jgi:vitellogenic carboxypeptidase-like protein
LFNEHGPFVVDAENNVDFRDTAWTLTHSVLYIDNPVGAGYSFTSDDRGYAQSQDDVSRDLYFALVQFFLMFPCFIQNDFYITGESYAGKYIPALGHKIHYENHNSPPFKINLKGMAIGDGFSDPVSMLNYGSYLYNIGFLDYNTKLYFDKEEARAKALIEQGKYLEAFQVMDALLLGWNTTPSYYTNQTGFKRYYNYLKSHEPPEMNYYSSFVQQDHVRRSIHVGNQSFGDSYLMGKVEKYLQADIFKSVKPWVEELLNATENYRILMYSGQLDIIVASPLTDNFIRSMKWKHAEDFSKAQRKIWRVGKEIAGYAKAFGSFTQLVVRNAGHIVPFDQPGWSFDMINRFTTGKAFA